jgi:chromosome segregation ATPase
VAVLEQLTGNEEKLEEQLKSALQANRALEARQQELDAELREAERHTASLEMDLEEATYRDTHKSETVLKFDRRERRHHPGHDPGAAGPFQYLVQASRRAEGQHG